MSIFKTRYRVVQRKNTPHGQFRIEVSKPSDFWVWKDYESYATCLTLDEAKTKIANIKDSLFSEVVYKE